MQFSCESCKAQLQIADEKVRGKRLLVRCKRCGAKIGIADPALAPKTGPVRIAPAAAAPRSAPAPQAPPSSPPAAAPAPKRRDSDTESTRAMDSDLLEQALQASKAEEAPAPRREVARERVRAPAPAPEPAPVPAPEPAPARDPPVWFAMVHGKQTGPATRAELAAQVDEGAVGPRTYLWKDGMGAWQRAREIPELQALFPGFPGPAAPAQQAPAPPSRAVREFTAADLAAPAPASVPALELETPVGGVELNGDLGAFDPAPASPRTDPEGVANELFAPESGEVPKSAADLAGWATAELQKKPAPAPRPRVHRASFNFEGATPRQSGLPLAMIGVVAVLALVAGALWFFLGSGPAPKPPEQKQEAASAAPAPATPEAPPQQRAKDAPAAKPEPPATGLTADQVRKKLDENKGALQGCIDEALRRDPNLRVGKIHIATRIAPSGTVTTAKIDKGSVEQSPLGACLRKATKRIVFPPFSGDSFDVDVPIVVTAGD